ncbi:MAG: hypothetical protein AABY22_33660 [Nanoarchaeota archaeon]
MTKELADKLKAEEYLANKGYCKIKCDKCNGLGTIIILEHNSKNEKIFSPQRICFVCDGKGFIWQASITK